MSKRETFVTINATSAAGTGFGINQSKQARSGSISSESSFDKILEDFKKVASQTPAERAAEGVLKKHGLTREQLDQLPKAQRDGIMREIEEAVRRAVGDKDKQSSPPVGI